MAFEDQRIVDAFYKPLLELDHKSKDDVQIVIVDKGPSCCERARRVDVTRDAAVGRFGLVEDEHSALPEPSRAQEEAAQPQAGYRQLLTLNC